MVVAAEIHTATHFWVCNIVNPTGIHPLASTFASRHYKVRHSCMGWNIQTSYWSIMISGRVKLPITFDRWREARMAFPTLSPNSVLRNVLVEYAMLVSQSSGEGSSPQLHGWSTRTTESHSFWCILWTCIVGRRIVQTCRILLATIGLRAVGGLKIPKHCVCHHHRP